MALKFAVDTEFKGRVREISMARILAFSGGLFSAAGWPAKNLHTDPDKAAEAGLSLPIASGMQCEGDVVRLLDALFGAAWRRHGRIHVKYPNPVFAGTSLQAHARVRARQETINGTVVELDVWCESLDNEIVLMGTASCIDLDAPEMNLLGNTSAPDD